MEEKKFSMQDLMSYLFLDSKQETEAGNIIELDENKKKEIASYLETEQGKKAKKKLLFFREKLLEEELAIDTQPHEVDRVLDKLNRKVNPIKWFFDKSLQEFTKIVDTASNKTWNLLESSCFPNMTLVSSMSSPDIIKKDLLQDYIIFKKQGLKIELLLQVVKHIYNIYRYEFSILYDNEKIRLKNIELNFKVTDIEGNTKVCIKIEEQENIQKIEVFCTGTPKSKWNIKNQELSKKIDELDVEGYLVKVIEFEYE